MARSAASRQYIPDERAGVSETPSLVSIFRHGKAGRRTRLSDGDGAHHTEAVHPMTVNLVFPPYRLFRVIFDFLFCPPFQAGNPYHGTSFPQETHGRPPSSSGRQLGV
jgi:hypothetical protein